MCFQGKYRYFFIACPRILMKSLQVCVLSKGRKNALRSLGKQVIGQGYIFSIHLQIFDEVNMQRRITFCVSNSSLCFCIIFDHEMVGRDLLCTWSAHSYPSSATFARVVQTKGNGTVCPKILFEEQCMLRHLTLHCIKQTLDDTKHDWNNEEL